MKEKKLVNTHESTLSQDNDRTMANNIGVHYFIEVYWVYNNCYLMKLTERVKEGADNEKRP